MSQEHDHEYMHAHNIPHEHDDAHAHEHTHTHAHEHTHEDGVTHSHSHDHAHSHPHTHDGEHAHEHPHGGCPGAANCGKSCDGCDADPRAEIVALMRYMVNHNTAHANELAQLAERLKELGDAVAYEQVMQAVSDFEKGNLRLSTVLAALNVPQ